MTRNEMLKRLKKGEGVFDLSIEKWKDIVERKGKDLGRENCALCETCFENDCEDCKGSYEECNFCEYEKIECKDCPVYKKTERCVCGTPHFTNFGRHIFECPDCNKSYCSVAIELAKEELKFFKGLKEKPYSIFDWVGWFTKRQKGKIM